MAEVYNPLYFSLVKSLYDNKVVNNQFVANLTETGHMFQISAQGFQKITGISWADWQAQHDTTTPAPTTEAPTTEAETTETSTTSGPTTDSQTTVTDTTVEDTTSAPTTDTPTTESKTTDKTTTEVTSKVPDSDNVIQ